MKGTAQVQNVYGFLWTDWSDLKVKHSLKHLSINQTVIDRMIESKSEVAMTAQTSSDQMWLNWVKQSNRQQMNDFSANPKELDPKWIETNDDRPIER